MSLPHREITALGRQWAATTHGVLSRRQLNDAGIDRFAVRTQVRTERWIPLGSQAIRVLDAPWHDLLSPIIVATFNAPRSAWADGTSALLLAGLTGWTPEQIDVGIPLETRAQSPFGVEVRRLTVVPPQRLVPVPYAQPAVASLRAAAWASSERRAAALLSMTVQQRLAPAERLVQSLSLLPRLPRRPLIRALLDDIAGGSESVGELDFARECRRRNLPVPDRQVRRRGPNGNMYLDAFWEAARLCVEIDGAHHYVGDMPIRDALRQNELALLNYTVIRIPRLALRTHPDEFFVQIQRHLAAHS